MGPSDPPPDGGLEPIPSESPSGHVHLIIGDAGNRDVIGGMLEDQYDVTASETVEPADLYLVEQPLLDSVGPGLQSQVESRMPVFCPVVAIRRPSNSIGDGLTARPIDDDRGLVVDTYLDAPIDREGLRRQVHSLMVRQRQSRELEAKLTQLRERERALRRFERLVQETDNAVAIADAEGYLEVVNPGFVELTGFDRDALIGGRLSIVEPVDVGSGFPDAFWQAFERGTEWAGELVLERADGDQRIVDVSLAPIAETAGPTEGNALVISDITDRINREQTLQEHREELDLLRQILTRYLRHNIRNDLTVIRGEAEMLSDNESASVRERASTILETADQLIETSDTARRYSRLTERRGDLGEIDLSELVSTIVAEFNGSYPDVEFVVETSDSAMVRAHDGFEYALEELIQNAAKHNTASEPRVAVTVTAGDGAQVVIEDNGGGIAEQELAALRNAAESPLTHSSGIGLWMSKWVIEGSDGRFSIGQHESGTTVSIQMPPPTLVGDDGLELPTLKEREQRFETIIRRMTDAIIEVGPEWELEYVDERAEDLFDIDTLHDHTLWSVFVPREDDTFAPACLEAMDERRAQSTHGYHPGTNRWYEQYVYPDFNGGLSLYLRDVTDREQQQQALESERRKFESLTEALPDVVYRAAPETLETTYVNDRVTSLFGYDTEEWIGDRDLWQRNIHPDDRERVMSELEATQAKREGGSVTYRFETASGEMRWVQDRYRWEWDDAGQATALVGVMVDITEKKRRERERRRVQRRLEHALDKTDALVFEVDFATGEVTRYGSFGQFYDATSADAGTWRRFAEKFVHDEDRAAFTELFSALEAGEIDEGIIEFKTEPSRGTVEWIAGDVFILEDHEDEGRRALGVARDISERKSRQLELRRLKERYQAYVEHGSDLLTELDEQGYIMYQSPSVERILGYDVDEMVGAALIEYVHPADRRRVMWHIEASTTVDETIDSIEYRIRGADGSWRWFESVGRTVRGKALDGFVINSRDITERKRREDNLKEHERRFEAIFNNPVSFMALLDPEGGIRDINREAAAFVDVDPTEVIGSMFWETPWWDHEESVQSALQSWIDAANDGENVTFEAEHFNDGGDRVVIDGAIHPITDVDGSVVELLAVGRDITERTEHAEALRERIRELTGIQRIVEALNEQTTRDPAAVLDAVVGELPRAMQYPSDAVGAFTWQDERIVSEPFDPADCAARISASTDLEAGSQLVATAAYPDVPGESVEPFLDEEHQLLDTIVSIVGEHLERVQYLSELETVRQRMDRILTHSSDYVLIVDDDDIVKYASPAVERVLGYDPAEVEGDRTLGYLADADVPIAARVFDDLLERPDGSITAEFRVIDADGAPRWTEIRARNLLDDPVIEGILVNVRDIEQRREHQRRYKAVFDHTFQYRALLEPDGSIIELNERAANFADIDRSAVRGQPFWEGPWFSDTPAVRDDLRTAIESAAAGTSVGFRRPYRRIRRSTTSTCLSGRSPMPMMRSPISSSRVTTSPTASSENSSSRPYTRSAMISPALRTNRRCSIEPSRRPVHCSRSIRRSSPSPMVTSSGPGR